VGAFYTWQMFIDMRGKVIYGTTEYGGRWSSHAARDNPSYSFRTVYHYSHTSLLDMLKIWIIKFFFENKLQWQFEIWLLLFTVCTCVYNFRPRL